MDKRFSALDLDALRSFVEGIQSASFAVAADRLCRSTSAVSAQLKKLEQQCGVALTVKQGRTLALTPEGEILLSYARRMLALNDEALRAIKGEQLQGEVRLGMQEDFGESVMPQVLGDFNRQHPELRLTARVERNQPLLRGVAANELDLALVWQEGREGDYVRSEPLAWICRSREDVEALLQRGEPLPLVMFDAPCLLRSRAIAALDAAGISWRIAFTSHSLSGLWAGVSAGLGITLRTRIGLPETLQIDNRLLPNAGELGIALHQGDDSTDTAISSMKALIIRTLNG
ncbi:MULTISPECIES: LysR substrate-binding domain-containing protein [Enterobacter]|uniref:LysR substrate-binding domain-containing protein n=1 Tax=Enterobacter nematophilus TaxID=2994648 RepID=A0ABT3VZR9_9ENTR|nr:MULTISPECIES: LysR substrate-binding domain-containing protein [Enterobacter]MCP1112247.1 LysR substrate-binding domain-containing protein [Enterobacter bugandensis]MCX5575081.1 LysR substrate-binding domain-containing protein [Enterobacter nematophilus]HBU6134024.1 LysR family transcriptional regulator [Enterobacter cloacae]